MDTWITLASLTFTFFTAYIANVCLLKMGFIPESNIYFGDWEEEVKDD